MRLILYTGKGGTGKTVTSCATALKCSELGYKTLLLSVDPAHTLSDALEHQVGNELTRITNKLDVLQIDPVLEMSKHYKQLLEYMASVFSSKGLDETLAYEVAMLPGMTQLFAMLKVEEIERDKSYDVIILDMMPSGEALRYLYFPKLVGSLSKRIMGLTSLISGVARLFEPIAKIPAPSSGVLKLEMELIDKLERLAKIFQDQEVTSIRLLANPDTFSIENAKRTLMSANLYGINVDLAIINKIMPKADDEYFMKWAEYQELKFKEAEANFYPLPIKRLRLFESELKGMDMLKRYAEELFKDEDPAKVFYKGGMYRFETYNGTLNMKVRVPFTSKDDLEIERIGDQLTIKVKSEIGKMVNIIPLPAATMGMKLSKAKLEDNELNIIFEKQ
ncbi:MAG: arsenic-transporting ATPase [Candidatus Nitrosocaldaceae archaeon]|nr:MAG: arsenic-transporting ATPase [Candidatus Nitrosocaldaceae archaeon]